MSSVIFQIAQKIWIFLIVYVQALAGILANNPTLFIMIKKIRMKWLMYIRLYAPKRVQVWKKCMPAAAWDSKKPRCYKTGVLHIGKQYKRSLPSAARFTVAYALMITTSWSAILGMVKDSCPFLTRNGTVSPDTVRSMASTWPATGRVTPIL